MFLYVISSLIVCFERFTSVAADMKSSVMVASNHHFHAFIDDISDQDIIEPELTQV